LLPPLQHDCEGQHDCLLWQQAGVSPLRPALASTYPLVPTIPSSIIAANALSAIRFIARSLCASSVDLSVTALSHRATLTAKLLDIPWVPVAVAQKARNALA
jgi:hypothetical protein